MAALRIGDAEREQAQAALTEHYVAGRLDHDEYSERLDQVWAARTRDDLAPVFRDLPGRAPARPAARTAPVRPAIRRPWLPAPLLVVLLVLAGVTVVTHLPVLLVAVAVWFLFLRRGCRPQPRRW